MNEQLVMKIYEAFDDVDSAENNCLGEMKLADGYKVAIYRYWDDEDSCWVLKIDLINDCYDLIEVYEIDDYDDATINALSNEIIQKIKNS